MVAQLIESVTGISPPLLITIAVATAVVLPLSAWLRYSYRERHSLPARSCLAPNRSRGRNAFCQNPTPRGGYCSTHHDQSTRDRNSPITAGVAGIVLIVGAVLAVAL